MAALPFNAMSMMSALFCGDSLDRIPALTSTPNKVMLSRRFSGSCSYPIVIAR
jgi:hypothetical protein